MSNGSIILGNNYAPQAMQDSYMSGDYEILGAVEILGDPGSTPAAKQAAMNRLIQARQAGGKVVNDLQPRREYQQLLPCTALAIAAGAQQTITLNPQRTFRARNFRASSTHSAPFFTIDAMTIGQDNQFVQAGSVPADLFSEVALYSIVEGQTANLGNQITLVVTNIDIAVHDFRGAFFGTALVN